MYVTSMISGFLNHIREQTLSSFNILELFVYDETLDFKGRATQRIAKQNIFKQVEGDPKNDWIFIMWRRGSLSPNSTSHNRPQRVTSGLSDQNRIDSKNKYRMAELDLELKIVTNNINIAERIEEFLHVETGESLVFSADYGNGLGDVKCSSSSDTTTSFEKEDISSFGSVVAIGLSSRISFPIFLDFDTDVDVIEHLDIDIYSTLNLDPPDVDSSILISEKIIEE